MSKLALLAATLLGAMMCVSGCAGGTPRVEDEARRQNRLQTPTLSGRDAEL